MELNEIRIMGTRRALLAALPPDIAERLDVTGGDTKLIYDPANDAEVENARRTFGELTKRGFRAFRVNRLGNKGDMINEFDAEAGKIILSPAMQGG